jgi:hypothetical protein
VNFDAAIGGRPKDWHFPDFTAGLGLVSAGHSGADTYGSGHVLPFEQLYRWTGDLHYRQFARLLLYNTKQPLDLSGEKGHFSRRAHVGDLGLRPGWVNVTRRNEIRGAGHDAWMPWTTAMSAWGMDRLIGEFGSYELD